jgi:hypothetical protein
MPMIQQQIDKILVIAQRRKIDKEAKADKLKK